MIVWEYDYLNDPTLSDINRAGQEGWELIGWKDDMAWLKRALSKGSSDRVPSPSSDRVPAPSSDERASHRLALNGTSGLADRLRQVMDHHGWSRRKFSQKAGLDAVHVGKILARLAIHPRPRMDADTLTALARAAGVTAHWLLTGEGPERLARDTAEDAPRDPRARPEP